MHSTRSRAFQSTYLAQPSLRFSCSAVSQNPSFIPPSNPAMPQPTHPFHPTHIISPSLLIHSALPSSNIQAIIFTLKHKITERLARGRGRPLTRTHTAPPLRHTHTHTHTTFLDDKNLPSVPPLQLSVPADYPDQSPHWADEGEQYGEEPYAMQ